MNETNENKMSESMLSAYERKRHEFDSTRTINKSSPCLAPFNNMYFTTEGNVAPCWLLVGHVDKWSSSKTMMDLWKGEDFQKIRENLKNGIFESSCRVCKQKIEANTWPLALAYDGFSVKEYPTLLELELSNQCNLECVMCEGRLSSGIRKNRDKLPPLPQVFDESFVEQVREFIPHLEELRFNGGEPFAQQIVYDICLLAAELNPSLRINIATNGTVYNKRVAEILKKCNVHINISIDSLIKKEYESIRINGVFEQLMENFEIFKKYCHENNRNLSVMVNPMRVNWQEMPNFVDFTVKHKVFLWFNTIHHPAHLGIWNLPTTELKNIFETLEKEVNARRPDENNTDHFLHGNWSKLDHFVNNQIKNWLAKQEEREKKVIQII